jgi:hypothetical protein
LLIGRVSGWREFVFKPAELVSMPAGQLARHPVLAGMDVD